MNEHRVVVVAGGAGQLGTHAVIQLALAGYVPVVVDNFSRSSREQLLRIIEIIQQPLVCREFDMHDATAWQALLDEAQPLAVIDCASATCTAQNLEATLLPLLQQAPKNNFQGFKIPGSVLVVIHTPSLQVLLLERADKTGFWQSVTGSKDHADEALADVARREVAEETGLSQGALNDWQHSIEYEIYADWRYRHAPGVTRNREHWFSFCVPENSRVQLNPNEHTRYEWLALDAAAQRCFSASNQTAILELAQRWQPPSGTSE